MEKVRINKYLRNCGIGSRRKVEDLILKGEVTVNGLISKDLSMLVGKSDTVAVSGKQVTPIETLVYYILNKPKGYECTHKSHNGEPTVYDLLPKSPPLFSVGRLDRETTGLLILTNDGDFANKVIHPSSNVIKTYIAETWDELTISKLQKIKEGTVVEETFIKPHAVEKISATKVQVEVKEGKKREVRILITDAGLSLKALSRTKIGKLTLGRLAEGSYKILLEEEKQQIFSSSV